MRNTIANIFKMLQRISPHKLPEALAEGSMDAGDTGGCECPKNPVVKKHMRLYNFAKTDLMFTQRCGNKCEEVFGMEIELTNYS